MIRLVATLSLIALLISVLYLPSAYPTTYFVDRLRSEHALAIDFWGHHHGTQILVRMLNWNEAVQPGIAAPYAANGSTQNHPELIVARQMSSIMDRLFNNPYFRSVEALCALALFRLSILIQLLPSGLAIVFAVLFDGLLVRIIKSKEFLQHDPEMFALSVVAMIITTCATVLSLFLPISLPPWALPFAPIALSVFASRAVAQFHRRG